MTKIKDIIIIGGGSSISQASKNVLQPILDTNCTLLTNYSYKHFQGTFLAFSDRDFYKTRDISRNPDIYDELRLLPLIVGINHNGIDEFRLPNTLLLDKNKIHVGYLTGIFAVSLAIEILQHKGRIFLLGYDWTRRNPDKIDQTKYTSNSDLDIHYYGKEIKHYGIGRIGYYENHNPDNDFKIFQKERDVKIFNVSLNSNINCFEKISYEEFYKIVNKEKLNQKELRDFINPILFSLSYNKV